MLSFCTWRCCMNACFDGAAEKPKNLSLRPGPSAHTMTPMDHATRASCSRLHRSISIHVCLWSVNNKSMLGAKGARCTRHARRCPISALPLLTSKSWVRQPFMPKHEQTMTLAEAAQVWRRSGPSIKLHEKIRKTCLRGYDSNGLKLTQ
jgi:hypothetical protein